MKQERISILMTLKTKFNIAQQSKIIMLIRIFRKNYDFKYYQNSIFIYNEYKYISPLKGYNDDKILGNIKHYCLKRIKEYVMSSKDVTKNIKLSLLL